MIRKTSEWTLWVVAVSCALHATEEYLTGWQAWAIETLGIIMPTSLFAIMNAVLVIAALFLARVGWRKPSISLIIPAATLVNGIFFHILPTIIRFRVSPGLYTSILLYLPFSSFALFGAWRDGVRKRDIVSSVVAGSVMMFSLVLAAKWFGRFVAQA